MPHKSFHQDTARYFSMITQLGLSIITPILLCLAAGIWLRRRFGLGEWAIVLALVLGLAAAVNTAFQYFHLALKEARDREKEEREA